MATKNLTSHFLELRALALSERGGGGGGGGGPVVGLKGLVDGFGRKVETKLPPKLSKFANRINRQVAAGIGRVSSSSSSGGGGGGGGSGRRVGQHHQPLQQDHRNSDEIAFDIESGPLVSDTDADAGGGGGSSCSPQDIELRNFSAMLPDWADILDSVKEDMARIRQRNAQLREVHARHLHPVIGQDEAQIEHQIEILTKDIKDIFKRCELQIIALSNRAKRKKSESAAAGKPQTQNDKEERSILANVQRALVNQLNELSQQFKQDQRTYLTNLRSLKAKERDLGSHWNDTDEERIQAIYDKLYDPAFTQEQVDELAENERAIMNRDKELRELLVSITDLQEIFKDLSAMVIEQGTVLDRIDYNIENVVASTSNAVTQLVKAEKYQRKKGMLLCIIFLVVFFGAMFALLLLKLIIKYGPTLLMLL